MIDNDDIQFSYDGHSYYSPVLVLKPTGNLGKKCCFYLNVVPENNIYSLHKFSPNINNIDSQWYFNNAIDFGKSYFYILYDVNNNLFII